MRDVLAGIRVLFGERISPAYNTITDICLTQRKNNRLCEDMIFMWFLVMRTVTVT